MLCFIFSVIAWLPALFFQEIEKMLLSLYLHVCVENYGIVNTVDLHKTMAVCSRNTVRPCYTKMVFYSTQFTF